MDTCSNKFTRAHSIGLSSFASTPMTGLFAGKQVRLSLSISPFHLLCLTTLLPPSTVSSIILHISNAWRLAFQMCKDVSTTLCLAILSVNGFRLSCNPYCTTCSCLAAVICAMLLEACPEWARVPNTAGSLSLHVLCECTHKPLSIQICQQLLAIYQDATLVPGGNSFLFLHSHHLLDMNRLDFEKILYVAAS
jgi:hypothetical protein